MDEASGLGTAEDYAEDRRKKNRDRMRRVRELAKRKRRCRVCGRPVVRSPRTGKPSRACKRHLLEDRARKTPPELPWLSDADLLAMNFGGGVFDFRKPYPLEWEEDWAWAESEAYRLAWEE